MKLKFFVLFCLAYARKKGGKKGRKRLIEKPDYGTTSLNDLFYPEAKLAELSNAGVDVSNLPVAQLFEDNENTVSQ